MPAAAGAAEPGGHLTERETLQLREGQLRGILDAASEAIVTVDEAQTIVMANARAAEIFGHRVERLIGMPLDALLPARLRALHAGHVARYGAADSAARRMGLKAPVTGLRANGEEFPLAAGISQAHADGTRLYTVILRDLSESRRAADALHTSEQLLAATFNVGSVGMAQLDPRSCRFVSANAAFAALSGYAGDELQALSMDRLDDPADPPCSELVAALQRGRATLDGDRRLRRKDGTTCWVHLSLGLVRDAQGQPQLVVCVVQDITARREALAALQGREARLAFLVRLNDRLRVLRDPQAIGYEAACLLGEFAGLDRVGYASDDGSGHSVTVARSYARGSPRNEGGHGSLACGRAQMEALRAGRTVVQPDIAADPTLPADVKASHAALQLGATVNVPLISDGRLIAVLFVHSRTARNWTADEVALFEDVAARVRADAERARAGAGVRAAKAKLEAALASMGDAISISDATGLITDINDAFATFHRFRGRSECSRRLEDYADILELTLADGTPAPLDQWPIPRALRGESATNLEFGLRLRRTGERWIGAYSFAPIRNAEGRIVGTVCSARDITESRRIRSQLEASQALLRRLIAAQDSVQEQERLRIARELHDELQQDLAAILMEAEVAKSDSGAQDARARDALARIQQLGSEVIGSMRRIVRDLRPQALEDLGLVAALQTLAASFRERTGTACTVDTAALQAADQPRLPAVATCLYRVVQEALNNVARHAGAHRVQVRMASLPGGRVELAVRDDGVGIRPEELDKPDSFGLAGMRERVRAIGGVLAVNAWPGGGTEVTATLPLPDHALPRP